MQAYHKIILYTHKIQTSQITKKTRNKIQLNYNHYQRLQIDYGQLNMTYLTIIQSVEIMKMV